MPRTRDPHLEEARRQRVAEAAETALAEGSWNRVTLADVARRAGVSKGVVTYWFGNKETLFLEVLRRYHHRYEQHLSQVAAPGAPLRERLERLVHIAFPDQATVAAEVRFQIEIWSYAKEHPAVLAAVREAYNRFRRACQALVAMAAAERSVPASQIDELYRYVHALIDGVSLHVALDPDIDLDATRARLIDLLETWLEAPTV